MDKPRSCGEGIVRNDRPAQCPTTIRSEENAIAIKIHRFNGITGS